MALSIWSAVLFFLFFAPPATPKGISVPDEKYTYIIVGGGTTGLVVARWIANDPTLQVSVLVVEAGPILDDQKKIDDVLLSPQFDSLKPDRTAYTWNITTVPNEALNGRTTRMFMRKVRLFTQNRTTQPIS
jgi:choline dehydrogenase-like flavoprotein